MNEIMPIELAPGDHMPMSWAEYEELGPEVRGEYIAGEFIMSPLPSKRHQRACFRLVELLTDVLPEGVEVIAGWGWKPGDDEFGPDVMVFDETDEEVRFTGTPYLCVEVLSTDRGADLVRKFARYADAGLPCYWVIDLAMPEIIVFGLGEGGGYREVTRLGGYETATLDIGPARVTLSPAELLG